MKNFILSMIGTLSICSLLTGCCALFGGHNELIPPKMENGLNKPQVESSEEFKKNNLDAKNK